jgi:hypothetical protein
MKKYCFALLLSCITACPAIAETTSRDFQMNRPTIDLITTPEYSVNFGPKNKRAPEQREWLEVEVSFDWQPSDKELRFLDELTVNYFILLNDNRDPRKNTLLTGTVVHTLVGQGKQLKSVMYVSPRALQKFFDGKTPSTATAAVYNVAATISHNGQVVAESSWKGDDREWWSTFEPVSGHVLNKDQTPFAPLAWDYYEAVKPR